MYYEINIAWRGHHFFATAERSLQSKAELRPVYQTIMEKFPASEGYKVTVTYNERTGYSVCGAELAEMMIP